MQFSINWRKIFFFFLFSASLFLIGGLAVFYSQNKPEKKIPILKCPVPNENCPAGHVLYDNDGKYIGIGYELKKGSSLLAAFEGTLQAGQIKVGEGWYPAIYLKDIDQGYIAYYVYVGPLLMVSGLPSGVIPAGSPLVNIEEGSLGGYEGTNFIFSFAGAEDSSTSALPGTNYEIKEIDTKIFVLN